MHLHANIVASWLHRQLDMPLGKTAADTSAVYVASKSRQIVGLHVLQHACTGR